MSYQLIVILSPLTRQLNTGAMRQLLVYQGLTLPCGQRRRFGAPSIKLTVAYCQVDNLPLEFKAIFLA